MPSKIRHKELKKMVLPGGGDSIDTAPLPQKKKPESCDSGPW